MLARALGPALEMLDRGLCSNVLGMVVDGYAEETADVIELTGALGIGNRAWPDAAPCLRSNAEFIYSPAASGLGTMEAEQQRVCGAGMDSVPCGWSVRRGCGAEHVSPVVGKSAAVRYAACVDFGMVAVGW